jgi:hypothetical protein
MGAFLVCFCALAGGFGVAVASANQTPVAAYSFDAGEGETLEDVTGNEHDGAIEGASWFDNGKYGSALSFDGENDCVTIADAEDLRITEELTVEAWVKPSSPLSDDPVIYKDAWGNKAHALGIGIFEYGKPEAFIGEGEGEFESVVAPKALEANVWTHLAFTYDGAHMRLYVDGELVASQAQADAPLAAPGDLKIGCSAWWWEEGFTGKIDEVRIYDRALSQAEVQNTMGALPSAETEASIETNSTYAVLSGKVDPHGGEATYWFEYGLTASYGQFGPSGPYEGEEIVEGTEPVAVYEAINGLEPNTTYHYRLVAYDGMNTTVGPDRTLTTGEAELESLSTLGQIFGLGYRSVPDAANPATAHLVAQSNATMFRVVIGCPNKTYDHIFEHAAEEGITILPDIVGVPDKVVETEKGSNEYECPSRHGNLVPPASERLAWKAELEAIINRYGHGGTFWAEHEFPTELIPDHWEIWNEPNTERFGSTTGRVNPAWYRELLDESHEAITKVNPGAQILIGGLLSVAKARPTKKELENHTKLEDHIFPANFLKVVGDFSAYDAVSLHPYAFRGAGKVPHAPSDATDVEHVTAKVWSNIAVVRATLNTSGSAASKMPIWITEIGWPVKGGGAKPDGSHWLVSDDTQRDLLNATFQMMKDESKQFPAKKFRIPAILYYNIADAVGAEPKGQWDYHCSLVEDSIKPEKGEKRKAWHAFQLQAE